mgnify:CR=1 FL=1
MLEKILDQSLLLQDLERSPSDFLYIPRRKENKAQYLFIYLFDGLQYLLLFSIF